MPAGLDSYVLLRRPDVLQAEYQLRAANAQIGAARAALFPRITLTGLLGFASSALTSLFTGGAFGWSAGANATYTIFQAGAGHANVRLSEAQRNAAVATYQRTVQTAFREVADALARRGTINDEIGARAAPAGGNRRHLHADRGALSRRHRPFPYRARRAAVLLCGAAADGADQAHGGAKLGDALPDDRRRHAAADDARLVSRSPATE